MADRTVLVTIDGVEHPVSGRVGALITWLVEHRPELTQPHACQLQVDMAGPAVKPRVTVFYGEVPPAK